MPLPSLGAPPRHQSAVRSTCRVVGLSLLMLVASSAHAIIGGYRQPVDPQGNDIMYPALNQAELIVNPARDVVTSVDGYQTITGLASNQAQGTIRGYASYQLDAPTVIARPANPGKVNVDGTFAYFGNVKADPALPVGAPVNAIVELTVHGSFAQITGQPWLALAGGIAVSRYHGDVDTYSAEVSFSNVTAAGWQGTIDAQLKYDLTGPVANVPADPAGTWAAGSRIISDNPDNLLAVLRLTIPVEVGDLLVMPGVIGATATHAYAHDPESISVGDDINIMAAHGVVDFSNTATLRVYLPAGYTLTGPNAPGSAILLTSAVPEPATSVLLLAGLGLVMVVVWRGQRASASRIASTTAL
jgi:hypothetical protein